jgi:hypothetical protein
MLHQRERKVDVMADPLDLERVERSICASIASSRVAPR